MTATLDKVPLDQLQAEIDRRKTAPSGKPTQHLVMILDRSGSMEPVTADVIGGTNRFIVDQQATMPTDRDAKITIVLFDNVVEQLVTAVPLEEAPLLSPHNYFSRGSTALLDALGKTMTEVSREVGPADRVLLVIYTDGFENASREYTTDTIKQMIEQREKKDGNWTVVYLGADQDAWGIAQNLGIQAGNTQSYRSVDTMAQMINTSADTKCYSRAAAPRTDNFFAPKEPKKKGK